jgi:hypothetical protein
MGLYLLIVRLRSTLTKSSLRSNSIKHHLVVNYYKFVVYCMQREIDKKLIQAAEEVDD